MKYAIVPVEFSQESYNKVACEIGHVGSSYLYFAKRYWPTFLAACPPLDAEMLAALELARRYVDTALLRPIVSSRDGVTLARALLRAAGEE